MSTYELYYSVVRRVPRGRVATYGTIAREAGLPGRARQVGYALAALPDSHDMPWHRIVNARGAVSTRAAAIGYERLQQSLLEAEGVIFDGAGRVSLDELGWP
jgi:methylated-DNA-protein-cysteine methyltransferase-like protein